MSSKVSGAFAPCLVAFFVLSGCTNPPPVSLARPQHRAAAASQALSSGYAGTATFDVPTVNPNTWQGAPMGTGTWSTAATPPLSGGPSGIGFYDTSSGPAIHYVMLGNFSAGSGHFFGIVSEGQPFTVGTTAINNTTVYAGIFDAATGDAVALASAGTLTLTAAGLVGGRITGSFTGTLDDVGSTGLCTSSAQCQANEVCTAGRCIPSGCTSNAQCATGQTCQNGACVAGPVVCSGMQGNGEYAGNVGNVSVCSALSGRVLNVSNALATIVDDGNGPTLYVLDAASDNAGAVIPLNGCPSATGSVSIQSGVFWDSTTKSGVTLTAARPITSGTLTYLKASATGVAGSFTLELIDGSIIKGNFEVH